MYQANETTVNDTIDVEVNISKEELTYRSKNFHELRSLKDKDAICCSCGNKLNVKLGNLFAHPIICILQCEACHNHIKKSFLTSTKQNRNQYCCFCGCSKNLHHCKKQQCEYAFCRPCIRRNSTLSLLDVDKNNWLCFICDTKPLWKARGVCATVLDTLLMNKNKRSEKTVIEQDKHDSSGESNQQITVQAMSRKNNDRAVATKKVIGTQDGKDDSIQIGSDDSEEIVTRRTQRTRNSKGDEKKLYFEKNQKNNISSSEEIEAEEEIPRVKRRRRLSSSSHRRSKVMQQSLNDEDSKSSSGREFEKWKLTRSGYSTLKKISTENIKTVNDTSCSSSDKSKTLLSDEQRFLFKSSMIDFLDKFRGLCTKFELNLEKIKCFDFRKELHYLENAEDISHKVMNLVNQLKIDLKQESKNLSHFHHTWSESNNVREVNDQEGDVEVNEKSDNKEKKKKEAEVQEVQDKLSSSDEPEFSVEKPNGEGENENGEKKQGNISECDADAIFSETEDGNKSTGSQRDARTSNETENRKQSVSSEDKGSVSPVLTSYKERQQKRTNTKNPLSDIAEELATDPENNIENKTEIPAETNKTKTSFDLTQDSHELSDANESLVDLFDASGDTESIIPSTPNQDKTSKSETTDKVSEEEVKECSTEETVPVTNNETEVLSTSVDEEGGKVESDIDLESETSTSSANLSDVKKAVEGVRKKKDSKNDSNLGFTSGELLSEENNDDNLEEAAKHSCLESNSNSSDSLELPQISDGDNSESESKTEEKENKSTVDTEKSENMKDSESSKQSSDDTASSTSTIGKTKSKRLLFKKLLQKYDTNKQLQMRCDVQLERLPKQIIKLHAKALQRSKQYLEEKRMKSLLDLDKLEKKRRKNVSSSSTPPNKAKRKPKEKESLLDHLHGIENDGNLDCVDEDSVSESDDNSNSMKAKIQTNKALMTMAEETTKENVLNSDSDLEDKIPSDNDDEKKDNKKKQKATTEKQARKKDKTDADQEKDTSKSDWRRDKILTTKFSDSDSDEEIISIARKRKKNDDDDDDEGKAEDLQEDSSKKQRKLRKRGRKRMVLSDSGSEKQNTNTSADSSDSDSSNDNSKNKSKKRGKKISDTDESSGEKKLKRVKRRRIKQMDSESNSNSDVDKKDDNSDRLNSSQGSNTPKGRKNIRKVLKDNKVAEDTKQAAKEEEERLKRIAERQKLYNAVYEASRAGEKKVTELILDFDPDTKKELVSVHKEIVKQLKPHQAEGIRFMWDSCYESLERLKTSTGSGCIIAHCMGLGKTLQVIGFVHTLLTNENVGVKTVMIVTPLSTVLNWINEFNMWLKDTGDLDDIDLYELTRYKKNTERVYMLQSWQKTGGVLVLGYEMFRNLTGTGKNVRKAMKEKILKCLIDPGPDIVICDEGHLLKNTESAISKCMNRVKTLRRIVLTGTPLQNNLIEYHCMVQFVKPSLLGTKKEFLNRFVNPITNGQFDDSTERDVKVMKKRAYVLHKMLKGCVQRFDYSVLTPFLPPKQEYVIFVTLSPVQIQLYRYYLENRARSQRGAGGSLFADFQELQRIWTHPLILQYHAKKVDIANDKKCLTSDSEGSLKDFIDDGTDSDTSSSCNNSSQSDDDIQEVKTERTTRSKEVQGSESKIEEEETENVEENRDNKWWAQYVRPEHLEDLRVSSKLVLLFGILKECEQIGDKLLVFSQSLYSLCLIEEFLQKIDKASAEDEVPEYLNEHRGNWILGADYFRLDGQTSPENRSRWCNLFNRPSNTRARLFLISTKAGGLGINLTAANRVVIFDASWNPSHDVQSIFRIYRFGQVKPCYVYRFLAYGTMEEKIYNRQVTKLSLSCRVVDVQQIERHYTNSALNELYKFEPNLTGQKPTLALPRDRLLAEIFLKYKDVVETYHEHDSLLENKTEEELDDEERKQAWLEYEEEKKGKVMMLNTVHPMQNNALPNQCNILANLAMTNELESLQLLIQKDYPHATAQQRNMIATRAVIDMYSYVEQQAVHGRTQNVHHAPQHVPLILQPQRLVQQQGRTITIGDAGGLHTGQVANVAGTSGRADTNDDDIVEVTTNRAQMPINVSQAAASNKNQEE